MSANNKSADEAIVNDALLEKLRTYAAKPQEAGDALRAIVAKIHTRITSSGTQLYSEFLISRLDNFVFWKTLCLANLFSFFFFSIYRQ